MHMDTPPCYYRVSIKALIYDETRTKILLTQEPSGKWELPGGGLDWGEDLHSCLQREIAEETGIQTTWIADTPSHGLSFQTSHGTWRAHILYEATIEHLNFVPSEECVALQYFTLSEMEALKLARSVPDVIEYLKKNTPA